MCVRRGLWGLLAATTRVLGAISSLSKGTADADAAAADVAADVDEDDDGDDATNATAH